MNKVGSMINKKVSSMGGVKKTESNAYKPAGVHVLGEDIFPQESIMENEKLLSTNITLQEKQNTNTFLYYHQLVKKNISSSMQDVFGISKKTLKSLQKNIKWP